MSKAQLVITAVVLEGRSKSEVARDYGVSRYWVQQLVRRYETEGAAAFEPRSRRPHRNPRAVDTAIEDKIVRLRKTLDKQGYDAGAATIAEHLAREPGVAEVPAVSTIWRILSRRGFITPQPQKRPGRPGNASKPNYPTNAGTLMSPTGASPITPKWRSSTSSTTTPASPPPAAPDPSRPAPMSWTPSPRPSPEWGAPAGVLTDNGAIFTAKQRGHGRTALEITLGELGIKYSHSRPYHPQTCGKIERFHQTPRHHRWQVQDSNLRRRKPTDLQSAPLAVCSDQLC